MPRGSTGHRRSELWQAALYADKDSVHVRISDPSRLLDLAIYLGRIGLTSQPIGTDTLEINVSRPLNTPADPMSERVEVVRGLRDWCSDNRGVHADLL
jgi:hypothetical protein